MSIFKWLRPGPMWHDERQAKFCRGCGAPTVLAYLPSGYDEHTGAAYSRPYTICSTIDQSKDWWEQIYRGPLPRSRTHTIDLNFNWRYA